MKYKLGPMNIVLRKNLFEDVNPKANASANAVLIMDKLRTNSQFMQMLSEIQLPSDKYRAIQKFADLLGIPEQRFIDFCQQQENITKQQ